MPNWCENKLIITTGNEEQLQNFVERVKNPEKNTDLSFEKLLPCPAELLELPSPNRDSSPDECAELIRKYGHTDWYDWALSNWGTKWDVNAKLDAFGRYLAIYLFESAWAPPVEWIIAAALEYPDLCFELKYDEPGIRFMGVFTAHGEKISEQCIDY